MGGRSDTEGRRRRMRRFRIRTAFGEVGEGVEFSSGRCSVEWQGTGIEASYPGVGTMEVILGEDAIRWVDLVESPGLGKCGRVHCAGPVSIEVDESNPSQGRVIDRSPEGEGAILAKIYQGNWGLRIFA